MIIVTGSPRTGTSLMMQTLYLLGIPIVGQAYHKDFSNQELNPKGYWELPIKETINGISTDEYKGRAVKLFGMQLKLTDSKLVSKVIVCVRKREDTLRSIKKLVDSELWQLEKYGLSANWETCERTLDANNELIKGFLEGFSGQSLSVEYESMCVDPRPTIEGIAEFVGATTSVDDAVKNVGMKEVFVWQQQG